MRNLLVGGAAAGLFLAFGAASAYAVPPNSPYAIMVPPGAVDGGYDDDPGYWNSPDWRAGAVPFAYLREGRSVYVEPRVVYGYGYGYPRLAPDVMVEGDDEY